MRTAVYTLVALLLTAFASAGEDTNPQPEITVKLERTTVLPGEPIIVDVSIENRANTPVEIDCPPGVYGVRFVDDDRYCDGGVVSSGLSLNTGSFHRRQMKAGYSKQFEYELETMCHINRPGKYRFAIQLGNCDQLKSETITITVQEPTTESDREVYNRIIMPCTQSARGCLLENAEWIFENHIDSIYVGHLLNLGTAFPVALRTDPKQVVSRLFKGKCISEHPIASYSVEGVDGDGERYSRLIREPMREYISSQRQRINDYLAIHPEFFKRDILEMCRAYHSLALGDTESALSSLLWVKENSTKAEEREHASEIVELLREEEPKK